MRMPLIWLAEYIQGQKNSAVRNKPMHMHIILISVVGAPKRQPSLRLLAKFMRESPNEEREKQVVLNCELWAPLCSFFPDCELACARNCLVVSDYRLPLQFILVFQVSHQHMFSFEVHTWGEHLSFWRWLMPCNSCCVWLPHVNCSLNLFK